MTAAKMTLTYDVDIAPDDNGTYLVTCPLLPEVTTFAESRVGVPAAALGAIEEALAARISYTEPVPVGHSYLCEGPDKMAVKLPLMTALKVQLYTTLRNSGITRAELSRRLGWHREQVDRLFRLDHASRLDQLEAAFAALDRELEVEVKALA
jgi:antitoxin HicB